MRVPDRRAGCGTSFACSPRIARPGQRGEYAQPDEGARGQPATQGADIATGAQTRRERTGSQRVGRVGQRRDGDEKGTEQGAATDYSGTRGNELAQEGSKKNRRLRVQQSDQKAVATYLAQRGARRGRSSLGWRSRTQRLQAEIDEIR